MSQEKFSEEVSKQVGVKGFLNPMWAISVKKANGETIMDTRPFLFPIHTFIKDYLDRNIDDLAENSPIVIFRLHKDAEIRVPLFVKEMPSKDPKTGEYTLEEGKHFHVKK